MFVQITQKDYFTQIFAIFEDLDFLREIKRSKNSELS